MRMAFFICLLAGMTLSSPHGAAAGEARTERPHAIVELFTSQGCSSCPPADRYLADLAARGDVVALAYHVDYWDYLGWRDTLASPDNSARQKEYGEAFGSRAVYTPQAVVNGREHMNGADRGLVEGTMARLADARHGMQVDVSLHHEGDDLVIQTGAAPAGTRETQIMVVYFKVRSQVEIAEGKNGGRSVVYHNAVRDFHSAGSWDGKPTRIQLPLSEVSKKGADGCAVLIQEVGKGGEPGAIIGAAVTTDHAAW